MNKIFYYVVAFIGILIYLSTKLIQTSIYLIIQPYILAVFFILSSLFIYTRTKKLDIKHYLITIYYYIALFLILLLGDIFLLNNANQFWFLDIIMQLSVCGTSVLIGYGISSIIYRLTIQ